MRRRLLPSAGIEKEIEALLAGELVDVHPLEVVSELGRLGGAAGAAAGGRGGGGGVA